LSAQPAVPPSNNPSRGENFKWGLSALAVAIGVFVVLHYVFHIEADTYIGRLESLTMTVILVVYGGPPLFDVIRVLLAGDAIEMSKEPKGFVRNLMFATISSGFLYIAGRKILDPPIASPTSINYGLFISNHPLLAHLHQITVIGLAHSSWWT
jgi:hypothetical protein